mmetsp:Transcript_33131/g.36692  ORF Transcript_33131/g.36692 Transcript_33131/m.36692 type:complete len:293 (+) Transcript_33131:73-951(+)
MNSIIKHASSRMIPLAAGMMIMNTSTSIEQELSDRRISSQNFSFFNTKPSITACDERPATVTTTAPGRNFLADAAERSLPSVVRIEVETESTNEVGSGSGVLLEKSTVSGDRDHSGVVVVTNAHVILTPDEFEDGGGDNIQNRRVKIESFQGDIVDAKVASFDIGRDLAILEIDEREEFFLKGAEVSMGNIRHGEFVVALGSPLRFENSVTAGIVSNPKRKWDDMHYIQSDVSVHTGNSGGPIVNMDGQVIGITSLKVADGISFAIPIKDAISVLRKLMKGDRQREKTTLDN